VAHFARDSYVSRPETLQFADAGEGSGELEGLTGFGGYEVNLLCDARVEVHLEVEL